MKRTTVPKGHYQAYEKHMHHKSLIKRTKRGDKREKLNTVKPLHSQIPHLQIHLLTKIFL